MHTFVMPPLLHHTIPWWTLCQHHLARFELGHAAVKLLSGSPFGLPVLASANRKRLVRSRRPTTIGPFRAYTSRSAGLDASPAAVPTASSIVITIQADVTPEPASRGKNAPV